MFNKKVLFGFSLFFILVLVGFIRINIINTKALSPIGNGEDNYELVKEEFGEEFEEFIKDKTEVKIYTKSLNNDNTVIKLSNKDYILKTDNILTRSFYNLGELIYNNLNKVVNTIKNIDINIIKNKKENTKDEMKNEDVEKAINEFLKDRK